MANVAAPSLEGDGIRFDFFRQLWNNKTSDGKELKACVKKGKSSKIIPPQIRLPDTVTFRLGQPLQWYFTSERAKKATILRKRKRNIKVENVEEVFLRKIRSAKKRALDSNDIVAYFIASGDTDHQEHEASCNIEYFNQEALHDFLFIRKKNQTGILQRFLEPSGGGKQNSQIKALCTPKMCVLDRRKTKQDLNDSRYGLYERAVTFEGPDVYSSPLPIRGAALPGKLEELCKRILNNISEATSSMNRTEEADDIRMVLHLKVDNKERIWVLYSSSIRIIPRESDYMGDVPSNDLKSKASVEVLNTEELIQLAPSIKMTQNANHDPTIKISNKKSFISCLSCANMDIEDHFQPVPYKTIISHYEKVMEISVAQDDTSLWPPHPDLIKIAGGVGFGGIRQMNSKDRVSNEDVTIPPVIRQLYPRLKVDGYLRYRSDPLFLHKKCKVCEDCFLSYANLVSTSFQINKPIPLDSDMRGLGFGSSSKKEQIGKNEIEKTKNCTKETPPPSTRSVREKYTPSVYANLFVQGPSLPPAILEPPKPDLEEDKMKFMPLSYASIESANQPLMHLITTKKRLDDVEWIQKIGKKKSKKPKELNPYEIPLKIVDETDDKRRKKQKNRHSSSKPLAHHVSERSMSDTTNTVGTSTMRGVKILDEDETLKVLTEALSNM